MQSKIHDLLGVGLGPFNLGLAALALPLKNITSIFLEKNSQFNWHPGLLFDDADLQVPFLADLVTMADPTHPLSFLQYLHEKKRLYKFYFRENMHILRQEYNDYCQWAANKMPHLRFDHAVHNVRYLDEGLLEVEAGDKKFLTKHLAIGIGTQPAFPMVVQDPENYIHSANYLFYQPSISKASSVTVIGSGQSAAEIILDLLKVHDTHPKKIWWVTRSPGFFPMEYSKLGLEHFSPDYMQYFYQLEDVVKENLLKGQDLMYKGISFKTIGDIFDRLYQLSIQDECSPLMFLPHCSLQNIQKQTNYHLQFQQKHLQKDMHIQTECVVFATGYRANTPVFLQGLAPHLQKDAAGNYALNADFSIKTKLPNKIFMQNNTLYSHGIGSPDLGLGCYRNSVILNNIANAECYPVHAQNVFQQFNLRRA